MCFYYFPPHLLFTLGSLEDGLCFSKKQLTCNWILFSWHFDPAPLIISTTGPARLSLVFQQSKLKQPMLQINEDIQWNSPRAYLVRTLQGKIKKTCSKKTTHHCKSAEGWNCIGFIGFIYWNCTDIYRCLRTQMSKFRQRLGFDNGLVSKWTRRLRWKQI